MSNLTESSPETLQLHNQSHQNDSQPAVLSLSNNPASGHKPTSPALTIYLEKALQGSTSVPCSCNKCSPHLYLDSPKTCPFPHSQVSLVVRPHQQALIRRKNPPTHSPHLKFEALSLADSAIQYFTRPRPDLSAQQHRALADFSSHLRRNNLGARLGQQNCELVVQPSEMQDLIAALNCIFFFDAIAAPAFSWASVPEYRLGSCVSSGPSRTDTYAHTIVMHPSRLPGFAGSSARDQRIGVLLHELVHAFLSQLACPQCRTAGVNVAAAGGHGRAWHRLATAVESVVGRMLGLGTVRLGRADMLLTYWGCDGGVGDPSRCDLEAYGLVGEDGEGKGDAQVSEVMECSMGLAGLKL